MAGFETRAIWGADPGLVSDRFRYTGVSVPPLDEEAIKRIQQQATGFLKSTINPFEVSLFPRIPDLSFIDFSTPQPRQLQPGDLFSPGLTDLIKQPVKSISPPARRGGLDSFFSIKNTADRKKIFGGLISPPTGFGFQNTAP